MSEWKTIGEVAEIFDGPHATPNRTSKGPVFLGISSLEAGKIDLSKSDHISEKDFKRWTKRVTPQEGDVVFSYETRLGEAAIIPKGLRCCLGRRMGLLRVEKTKVDPHFVLYSYLSPYFQNEIMRRTNYGSTVNRIALKELGEFPIKIPPLEEQQRIAGILSSLDDKIALNRRTNATLEAMAQALFKSWFVDFDPVIDNALESGRPLPEALRARADRRRAVLAEGKYPRLPAETRALFPDGFWWSEEMEKWVPEGWGVEGLSQLAQIKYGKSHRDLPIGLTPVFGSGGYMMSVEGVLCDRPSVIIPRKGSLDNLQYMDKPFWVTDTMFYTLLKEELYVRRLFLSMRSIKFSDMNAGSAVPSMTKELLAGLKFIVPSIQAMNAFNRNVGTWWEIVGSKNAESKSLAAFREVLLKTLICV